MLHLKTYSVVLGILFLLFAGAILHSGIMRSPQEEVQYLKCVSPVLPSADPGMDNSARYVRHLGLSTPASAFPDYPGQPDYLPAGTVWPPPSRFQGLVESLQIQPKRP